MDIEIDTIVNDNILNVLPKIPSGTFNLVLLDVPYEQEARPFRNGR